MVADRGQRETLARRLPICLGLGISVSAASLGGCGSIANPLDHYEAVYTKAALETPAPDPAALSHLDAARVIRGRCLVEIAGCSACHTDGALIGEPNATRLLAGSQLGIAYANPFRDRYPGVAYPSNLTPDPPTGLGNWSDAQMAAAIRSGALGSKSGHLIVMDQGDDAIRVFWGISLRSGAGDSLNTAASIAELRRRKSAASAAGHNGTREAP